MEFYVKPLAEVVNIKTGKLNSNAAVVGGAYPFFTCAPEPLAIDKYKYDQEAILLAGNNAEGNFHINFYEGKFEAYQRTYIIDSKDIRKYDLKYLYYALKECLAEFKLMSQGTSTKFLTMAILNSFKLNIPSIDNQKKVAKMLSLLDEKIENNKKINNNLQQQLRAIFKEKFTDNPELETVTQIPLSKLCHVVTKGTTPTTLGKSFVESGINFIKAESILDDHSIDKNKFAFIDDETNMMLKRSIIQAGDIVFTIAGTLGRFSLVDENVLPANTNQAVAIIRADAEKVLPEHIYTCFIGEWHNDYYAKRVQQAVQANLSLTTIKSLPIPILDEKEMNKYLQLIIPIIRAIKGNEAETEKLAALRNTLLPKLMSGKIDVSNIQI